MTQPKFTPGPWMISRLVEGAITTEANRLENLLGLDDEGYAIFINEDDAVIAAAAPDMYAALEAMVNDDAFADLCAGIGEEPQWLKDARAALAKAGRK